MFFNNGSEEKGEKKEGRQGIMFCMYIMKTSLSAYASGEAKRHLKEKEEEKKSIYDILLLSRIFLIMAAAAGGGEKEKSSAGAGRGGFGREKRRRRHVANILSLIIYSIQHEKY